MTFGEFLHVTAVSLLVAAVAYLSLEGAFCLFGVLP